MPPPHQRVFHSIANWLTRGWRDFTLNEAGVSDPSQFFLVGVHVTPLPSALIHANGVLVRMIGYGWIYDISLRSCGGILVEAYKHGTSFSHV